MRNPLIKVGPLCWVDASRIALINWNDEQDAPQIWMYDGAYPVRCADFKPKSPTVESRQEAMDELFEHLWPETNSTGGVGRIRTDRFDIWGDGRSGYFSG